MFYSHQLLSKKGPFGQIWIAATVHPKMNRKRTDQIDIEESCMQIINPVVPLALRLSGILMGGIVRIYNHKVKFLYGKAMVYFLCFRSHSFLDQDDVTEFMVRKFSWFEAITIDGTEETFQDFERAMLEPETPDQDDPEFFTVPPLVARTRPNRFQGKKPEPHKPRKKRKTIKQQKKLVYDVELTEIPAQVFQSWLQDTSNIIYRRNRRKVCEQRFAFTDIAIKQLYTQASAERAKVMLNNPLTFLGCGTIPKSLLPASIVDLWSKATVVTPRQQKTTSEQQKQQEQQTSAKQQDQQVSADQSPPPPLEFAFEEPERFEAPFNFDNYGSVEKLRAPVQTPVTGSEGGSFFDVQTGVTPNISVNSVMNSKRKRSSQSTDKLVPDVVGDYPTSLRSKRSRASERKSDSPFGTDFYTNDVFPEERTPDITVLPSQFETEPTQAAQAYQRDLDKLTSIMLQYLREHFISSPGIKALSLDSLTEGMNASQGAKMFFHICVLASNSYLSVLQKEAYGDILVGRGSLF
ncbi:sister chromatid cohesion 1 protein 1 [Selaginella moellendorffii]|uniref:sister chromatid cohesion 1 protein 1 n=1 Tax=Selaginella moellendorffii TaxID=88036 RepID=UPI000D1CA838|nr:sister chromatid cohesion 1 protein 1 [Selaginella moellendorffii]|eukprot:XP_024524272.1 sister chromatid cohesion 1 protein 1 [Selaginella moellendorffii]